MISNKEFKKHLAGKKLIILGEMHGAEANPKVIDAFVKAFDIRNILIEVENRYKKLFMLLKRREFKKFFRLLGKDSWIFEAGVIGASHIELFQKYLHKELRIIPIKVESKDWNTAEAKTARNIEKVLSGIKDNNPVLLVVGHLHARKIPFRLDGKLYKPIGSLLNKKSLSVQIRYGEGEIFNFRKMKIQDNYAKKYVARGIKGLMPSNNRFFDYFYIIPSTKPLKLAIDK